ncbi:MAG TPA: ABC transporter permease subunit, partial [Kiloniellaceae bacterium]|nr:ABC transporter permease subunit [Kiloniellaceae bacterium]
MSAAADLQSRPGLVGRVQVVWVAVLVLGGLGYYFSGDLAWLSKPPVALNAPLVAGINSFMDWFVATFQWFFKGLNWLLEWPLLWVQTALQWLPWFATLAALTALAFVSGGRGLAIFTALALFYMVLTGYWAESMNTLALVGVSVPLAVAIGFGLGVWGYRSDRAEKAIQPLLDLMQTVPTFAYLIPILLLFGFGPVVGLIASAIYASPPMVRNVMHGLRRIPPDILESGRMCGTTRRQRFWLVEVPTALPQIMVGVNQTTMAALSMVIIAAIIGGFDDIGWEVLSTMRKAQFGQSLLSGAVIALIAMVMDRISWGFTQRDRFLSTGEESFLVRHRIVVAVVGALVLCTALAQVVPFLADYPDDWRFYPAEPLNEALSAFVVEFGSILDAVKNGVNFFFLLPIKIGLNRAISPFSWGFVFTDAMRYGYWAAALALTGWTYWRRSPTASVLVAIAASFLYFGITGTPWPIFFAVVAVAAWQAGGWPVALFAGCGMAFILLSGLWPPAMLSVYLCGAAVLFCALVGGAIGVWAARNDRVSRAIRPINDSLQTMPQFVYLIPILMFFQV